MAALGGALHVGLGALGASVATAGYVRGLRRAGLDPDRVRCAWGVAMALGLLLSRLAFGVERDLGWAEMLRPNPGGYILYGALPAVLIVPLWLRLRGVEPSPYLDHAAPWILFGLVPGRIGCWLVGCCGGISVDGSAVPVPLLAAVLDGVVALALQRRLGGGAVRGTASLALCGHATARTLLDPFRVRSVTQIGVALPLALYGLLRFWQSRPRDGDP